MRCTFVLGLLVASGAALDVKAYSGTTSCEGTPTILKDASFDHLGPLGTCMGLSGGQPGAYINVCTSSALTRMFYDNKECTGMPYATECAPLADPPIEDECTQVIRFGECIGDDEGDSMILEGSCDSDLVAQQHVSLAESGANTGDFNIAEEEDDAPCFSRNTHTCRVLDANVAPTAAFSTCFGGGGHRAVEAERVLMSDLSAGDYVLSDPSTVTRVIVNQHRVVGDGMRSSVVDIAHSSGHLSLTPDHVLLVEGEFAAARSVKVGSRLSDGATVTAIKSSVSAVINPLTSSGTILAAGTTGHPVLSSTYPEWMAYHMLGVTTYPLPYSLASGLSYLFPQHVQAYYDALLEPAFAEATPLLKTLKGSFASPAAVGIVIFLLDLGLSAGFVAYSVASLKGIATIAMLAAALKALRAKA